MTERTEHTLRFADGGTLALGRRTAVMGVLNVTPDSFSDGGRFLDPALALEAATRMADEGADIVDIGGESTRPGAAPVDPAEEASRILPVIEALRRRLAVRVSVDTRRAEVARRALDAGADMVNDVSGLSDPGMLPLLCERQVPIVLMHMRGTPATMQRLIDYDDVIASVVGYLGDRVESARAVGLGDGKILVDPGLGFAKSMEGNLAILRELPALHVLGQPILIGASRKSFIGSLLDLPVGERLEGSLAVAAWAAAHGAHVVRVHDVGPTVRVVRVLDAIRAA